MTNQLKIEKKKMNPILWFLFAIIIPIAVALTLAFIIFSVAGFDVAGWAKNTGSKIPIISSMITTEEQKEQKQADDKREALLASKDMEIQQLTEEISDLEATVVHLQQEVIKLEKNNSVPVINEEVNNQEVNDMVKKISSSFKEMDNKQAALIFDDLDNDTAVLILHAMSNKVRGKVMEAMEPKKAAELAKLFIGDAN